MKLLGLDVSTYTGLAILDSDTGQHVTKLFHFGKTVTGMRRVQSIARATSEFMVDHKPDILIFESLAFGNKNTLSLLTEIQTGIKLEALRQGLGWWMVPPTVLKLWTTGKGKADKKAMAQSVADKWGFTSASDDVVDAYALARIGVVLHLHPDEELRKKVKFER